MKNILFILFMIVIAIVVVVAIVNQIFQVVDVLHTIAEKVGGGSILRGIIATPFAIYGFIRFIKGAFLLIERDGEKYRISKDWQIGLYGVFNILGYICLALLIRAI